VLQLSPSRTELTNAVTQRATRQSAVFFIFFKIFYKNKNVTCQVPMCDMWHWQCHVAL